MLRFICPIAVWALVATAAHAQSTTNCRPTIIGMPSAGVTCETNDAARAAPAVTLPVYSWKDVKPEPCSKFEAMSKGSQYCDARQAAATRKGIGDQIAAGKCDDALKAALGTGDFAFAREVKDFCAAPK